MIDPVAMRMSEASSTRDWHPPRKGERFRCEECGMEIQVTTDCRCQNSEHAHFECCGQEMVRVE